MYTATLDAVLIGIYSCLFCLWSDDDYRKEEVSMVNPLIVVGCTGSGKTSLVYACAEAVGFQVVEVSIPSISNGTELLKKCRESVQSHGLNMTNDVGLNPLRSKATTLICSTSKSQFNL